MQMALGAAFFAGAFSLYSITAGSDEDRKEHYKKFQDAY